MTANEPEPDVGPRMPGGPSDSAEKPDRRVFRVVAAIVLLGGATPLILYGLLAAPVRTVTPDRAKQMLRGNRQASVLVDVRPEESFAAGHIDGAVSWPLEDLLATRDPAAVPPDVRGKTLLLVCDVGLASRWAAWHLSHLGVERAVNVRGGIQEWIRSAAEQWGRRPRDPSATPLRIDRRDVPRGELFDRWRIAPDRVVEFPFRQSPVSEQATAVLAFFVVKPIYTLLSLFAVVILWRSREPDLVALRWSMICFFLGENACAANYLLTKETSYLLEYLHCLGMLSCFGFATYAVLEGVDRRILMLSHPQRRCAALKLCGECIKYRDVPCGLQYTFYVIIAALIFVALMLPTADWQDNAYNTWVFGQVYNYAHLRVFQQLENWYCAAAAILMLGASLAIVALKGREAMTWAKIAFAAGVGPLGFGMLRMVLGAAYDQNRVWYLFWEETTELLFILGVCIVLTIFRHGLGLVPTEEPFEPAHRGPAELPLLDFGETPS